MAKPAALQHVCSECGTSSGRWLGRCPGCGEFGTLVVEAVPGRGAQLSPHFEHQARPLLRLVDVVAEETERKAQKATKEAKEEAERRTRTNRRRRRAEDESGGGRRRGDPTWWHG